MTSKAMLDEHDLSSDVPRQLRCLVEGESHTFPVTVLGNEQIADLKAPIYEKGIHGTFRDILAKDLVLLKVSYIHPTV